MDFSRQGSTGKRRRLREEKRKINVLISGIHISLLSTASYGVQSRQFTDNWGLSRRAYTIEHSKLTM